MCITEGQINFLSALGVQRRERFAFGEQEKCQLILRKFFGSSSNSIYLLLPIRGEDIGPKVLKDTIARKQKLALRVGAGLGVTGGEAGAAPA